MGKHDDTFRRMAANKREMADRAEALLSKSTGALDAVIRGEPCPFTSVDLVEMRTLLHSLCVAMETQARDFERMASGGAAGAREAA